KEIIDKYHDLIKKSFSDFGISFDNYSRTSSKIHHETASEFFKFLENKKVFEIKDSKQLYDPQENQFLADRFVEGECPNCGFEHAYGDQCENCGSSLSPEELINPISKISGAKPIEKETKHWYLPLGNYEEFLKEWFLKGKKNKAKTNVYGQVKSWVDQGLESRAITRDLDWGIPVPSEDGKGKVLYVWFDAPIGYISSTKEWAKRENKNWEPYWKDKNTKLVHFIGKDNIVFHCIIFPIILKAHGEYILPENVPANEFLNLEGNKFSTSKNWAIWLDEFLVDFPGMQDSLRYTLTVNAPETKDNDFTWKDFQARNNNELVATFGNFINRVFVLTHKYFDGSVPENSGLNDIDLEVLKKTYDYPKLISESLDNFKFRQAVSLLIDLSRLGNKYLADEEPWKLYKLGELKRVKQIMFVSLQVCGMLAILSQPFLPNASKKIKEIINLKETKWTEINIDNPILNSQNKINKPELIFRKIEDEEIENQIEKLKG
ncbi:MAG: methionine--tRNA ligase, partial [Flavobacteriaceae bacterium]|nr:methionine--tRNA ligase [Flavobacteriaceae bacterium]